ncbi:MAG: hypothetical protein D6753_07885 [Planctomycetota bacterium]|nr:MAG: hypothetical protein D6753_07885 [Planctomycetota bacterium]
MPKEHSPSRRCAGPMSLFEPCERRLVLSAQLLFDVLGDVGLDQAVMAPGPQDAVEFPVLPQLAEAHAATGWDLVQSQFGLTGRGQTVAVIDSGVAWDHQALGQGFGPGHRVVGGWDFAENDADPYDDAPAGFHGTHVSGIVGSADPQHRGVAPGVDLVALRVFDDMGQGRLDWVENALRWVHANREAFDNPITTVNLSLGTQWNSDQVPSWATLEDEFQLLANDGILVTAAAGNSFQQYLTTGVSYPAASPYVLPVASLDDDGSLSDFSQRNGRVLAAPGSNIVSTVPDGFFGRDGVVNDFAQASGTSMAAPYVAGASVLVRQAMEMAGWNSIDAQTITDHLHATANHVFDAFTGAQYDALNLQAAIDAVIPDDGVPDTADSGLQLADLNTSIETWINHLGDVDAYQFTAPSDGRLTIDASSQWAEGLQWTILSSDNVPLASGGEDARMIDVHGGANYRLIVSAESIGPLQLSFQFDAAAPPADTMPSGPAEDLGTIDFLRMSVDAGQNYSALAIRDGTFTIEWQDSDSSGQGMFVRMPDGLVASVSDWQTDHLRADIPVRAGERVEFFLPSSVDGTGQLTLANAWNATGDAAVLAGSQASDAIELNLASSTVVFNGVRYDVDAGQLGRLMIDGSIGNDRLSIVGSDGTEMVQLRPGASSLESDGVSVQIRDVEQVAYAGGGGADRVYLYDSNTDDTLNIRPHQADLIGVGYRFEVSQAARIFVHATGGGQDFAFVYDSAGDDSLSVRPQFTSLRGDDYFNYVRGFERVFAYADAGGRDTASLYDSPGDDRFLTSGTTASIVGPGFSSFTRGFEVVHAEGGAGGNDTAALYGSAGSSQWHQGADFVSFREQGWIREARRFGEVAAYVGGQLQSVLNVSGVTAGTETAAAWAHPTAHAAATEPPAPSSPPPAVGPVDWQQHGLDPALQASTEPVWRDGTWERNVLVGTAAAQHDYDLGPETELLTDAIRLRDWAAERLHLPEEPLLGDADLEQSVLHEAFRQLADED